MAVQAPSAVVLIRSRHFAPNCATAIDNVFQSLDPLRTPDEIARDACDEVTGVAEALRKAGVAVHLFEDADSGRPDAVFPNNWFSTRTGGRIAVYPMYSSSR
jgi:hypothetical protein